MTMRQQTILMVEDDPCDRKLALRAFEKANLKSPIQVVADGIQAMHYLTGEASYNDRAIYPLPAVILMDINTPLMNGFEFLEWLRAQPKLSRLPVVVFSSSEHPSDVNRAYELGANSFILKPLGTEKLIATFQAFISYWLEFNVTPSLETD
ncbi:response regulator [Stieleria varia]|uniref:Response regulator rcp1 n=1 Tax=Stieleria varia TaxID=2528005 RepID=A0A5C6AWH4_9BACT|nr:response regulator [Stieleria varia]TWU04293.1 Response regulator rcp1 [Stieleria varia]